MQWLVLFSVFSLLDVLLPSKLIIILVAAVRLMKLLLVKFLLSSLGVLLKFGYYSGLMLKN